jgi:tRNA threonylcarbamoyladenosine biosynthesis protein TsaB
MPNILCVETSIGKCSVALKLGDLEDYMEAEKKFMQSELLFPLMQQLLARNQIDYKNIDFLACSLGPGSFTGVRIGVAAIRGVHKILPQIQLLGVSTLELMVSSLQLPVTQEKILAVLNASVGDLYAQEFNPQGTVLGPIYSLPEKELEEKRHNSLLVTEETSFRSHIEHSVNLTARTLLHKIEKIIQESKQESYKNIWPLYIKSPNITAPSASYIN